MRALFDVNFVIALLDAEHMDHGSARAWWRLNRKQGWASCPISQNGYLRITSQPSYPTPQTMSDALETLHFATQSDEHEFWPDEISLADPKTIDRDLVLGPNQLTDLYLLALAVRNGGRLVTFDRAIQRAAVVGATEQNLVLVSRA